MHPVAFEIGPFTLYSYGLMMALAWLVGAIWIAKRAKTAGYDPDLFLLAVFWLMISGVIGARLLYVYYFPDPYLAEPLKIITDRGGLVWYGGVIGAALGGVLFARVKQVSLLTFSDIVLPPVALGLAIGRIGCFLSGCCFGGPCDLPWAVQYPLGHESHPAWVHPTQLYETLMMGVVAWGLAQTGKTPTSPGKVTALFFIAAGLVRFLLEYLRGDGIYWVAHLFTASQTISLGFMAVGIGLLIWCRRQKPAPTTMSHSL